MNMEIMTQEAFKSKIHDLEANTDDLRAKLIESNVKYFELERAFKSIHNQVLTSDDPAETL